MLVELLHACVEPALSNFAVSIDKHHIVQLWVQLLECFETCVPRAARGEWARHVKLNNMRASRASPLDAAIR
jgi:hypothetical protein